MQDSEIFFLTNGGKILSGVDELNCPAELRVPFGVTKIERRALADCPAKKIFLPDTVTQIGYEAFSGCDALEYVRFPKRIESVEPSIFRGCFSLQKVELGDEILELSENMFECCYSLEEAPFRSGITELPRNVFSECFSLKSLVIPEGVVVIKSGAAAYCQNLSTLVLPSSVKIIEDDAFRSCVNLAHIRFSAENPIFFTDEDSGALFERHEDGTFSLIKVPVNAKQIRIPNNITHSHSEAFQGCDSIEKVFIDCALTDHPLFVALKTEIVDAEFVNENEIKEAQSKKQNSKKSKAEKDEAKSEERQKKPRKPRAKKNEVSAEKIPEAKIEEKEEIEKIAETKVAAEKTAASEKPKNRKSKKQIKNESANSSDEKKSRDEKNAGKKSSARVKKSVKASEVEKITEANAPSGKKADAAEAKSKNKGTKKTRAAKKTTAQLEIVEPETPEPSEPKIDELFADVLKESHEKNSAENIFVEEKSEAISMEEQPDISVEPQIDEIAAEENDSLEIEDTLDLDMEEPIVETPPELEIDEIAAEENDSTEIEDALELDIEEPIVETPPELEIDEIALEENDSLEIEDATSESFPIETSQAEAEDFTESQVQDEENSGQEDSSVSADDMLADILGQNIVSNEVGEEEGIEGVTITVEELDEAMMRGMQEEDECDYEVPEGFFPSKNPESEEEQENLPPPEPRFINGMIGVSSAYEVVEEKTLYPERADEDLCQTPPNEMEDITTLIVVTQSVTSENGISQSLKNFCIDLARKLGLKRIYFFGALSLDNEEFLYGFVKFALYRNVIYAADAPEFDSLAAEIKSFADIAEISSPISLFQNVAKDNSLELEMPFKIFVQDNLESSGNEQNQIQENSEEMILQTKMPASENESEHSAQTEKIRGGKGLLQKAEAALRAL